MLRPPGDGTVNEVLTMQPEDLSLDYQHPHRILGIVVVVCNISAKEVVTVVSVKLKTASLAKSLSSRFSERSCFKNKGRE